MLCASNHNKDNRQSISIGSLLTRVVSMPDSSHAIQAGLLSVSGDSKSCLKQVSVRQIAWITFHRSTKSHGDGWVNHLSYSAVDARFAFIHSNFAIVVAVIILSHTFTLSSHTHYAYQRQISFNSCHLLLFAILPWSFKIDLHRYVRKFLLPVRVCMFVSDSCRRAENETHQEVVKILGIDIKLYTL